MASLENLNDNVKRSSQTHDDFFRSIFVTPTNTINQIAGPSKASFIANDSGHVFYLTESAELSLPTAATAGEGWNVELVLNAAPSRAPGYFVSSSDTNNIHGNIVSLDTGNGVYGTDKDVITFVNGTNKAVKGDRIKIECDGTDFYVYGSVSSSTGLTLL
jgi:hypothetical protein